MGLLEIIGGVTVTVWAGAGYAAYKLGLYQMGLTGCINVLQNNPTKTVGWAVGLFSSWYFLQRYSQGGQSKYNDANLKGKVVIVTGGNTGIGFENAKAFANMGADVTIACRNEKRGTAACKALAAATGNGEGEEFIRGKQIKFMQLDLNDLVSVRSFAKEFIEASKGRGLNILVNNAGIMALPKRQETKQGFEKQIGVNHFGHFLLTKLLLPVLEKTGTAENPARVVNVSSSAHRLGKKKMLEDIDMKTYYSAWAAYGNSKLANVMFSYELNKKTGDNIVSASCHPGGVRTDLSRNMMGNYGWLIAYALVVPPILYYTLMKSAYSGAQTQLYLSVAPKGDIKWGTFYADCAPKKLTDTDQIGYSDEDTGKLWEISEQRTTEKAKTG